MTLRVLAVFVTSSIPVGLALAVADGPARDAPAKDVTVQVMADGTVDIANLGRGGHDSHLGYSDLYSYEYSYGLGATDTDYYDYSSDYYYEGGSNLGAEGCEDTNPQCAADWFTTSQCTQEYWANQCKKTCKSCSGGVQPKDSPNPKAPHATTTNVSSPSSAYSTPSSDNPFTGQCFYVNPSYKVNLKKSINKAGVDPAAKKTLEAMENVPSAFWISTKDNIKKGGNAPDLNTAEGILEDAAKHDPPRLVVLIVYDLPNRDCHALASNGEICCHKDPKGGCVKQGAFAKEFPGAQCKDGLKEYRETYIDPYVEVVTQYADKVPIVLIIEPDSLPNMATNKGTRGCHEETNYAYTEGIKYAVNAFAKTKATMYLDAAHGGWLGWPKKAIVYAEMIADMKIEDKIRGFATNVANYQPTGTMACSKYDECRGGRNSSHECCEYDPCKLAKEWSAGHTEVNYASTLQYAMKTAMPSFAPHFIIDTGRNGKPDTRTNCSNWCNIRGAGVGEVPTTKTALPGLIDAYYWLKTPGESDGCTKMLPGNTESCPRYDAKCHSVDSLGYKPSEPRAPEAGEWFHYQIVQLATNAALGPNVADYTDGKCTQ